MPLHSHASNQSVVDSTTISVVTTQDIPAGSLLVMSTVTATTSTRQNGIASISGGTWTKDAYSCRPATIDMNVYSRKTASLIPSGTTITVTLRSTTNRKAAILSVFTGIDAFSKSSGNTEPALGDTGVGPNGSSLGETFTIPSTTGLILGVFSTAGGRTLTPTTSHVEIAEITTASGSSDRGLTVCYLETTGVGSAVVSANMNTSAGWAAAGASYALDPAGPGQPGGIVIGGSKKSIANQHVIVDGVKKTVVNKWVIIGGVKKVVA